jgi:pseudoazurin|tara:strand:- start:200 stop:637 length:438 start_codon:yes stop_codon:yes gene_type:complete
MRFFIILLFGILFSNFAVAEDTTIKMLNKLDKRNMVFSLEIVKINSGDTVFWKATDKGHNVEFISKNGIPAGVDKFKSKVGKDAEFTFTLPGIYAYWCTPHKTMGMIGFVVVDNDLSNLDSIKKVKFLGKSKKIAATLIAEIEGK